MQSIITRLLPSHMSPKLNSAPMLAQVKNILEGEKRSTTVNSANVNVPAINPNCTIAVKSPKAEFGNLKFVINSSITAFPANHKEVHKNCAMMMVGNIVLEFFSEPTLNKSYFEFAKMHQID